jgi:hypothetical protein
MLRSFILFYHRLPELLPLVGCAATDGRRSRYQRRAACYHGYTELLSPAGGVATMGRVHGLAAVGGLPCYHGCTALLPSAGRLATMGVQCCCRRRGGLPELDGGRRSGAVATGESVDCGGNYTAFLLQGVVWFFSMYASMLVDGPVGYVTGEAGNRGFRSTGGRSGLPKFLSLSVKNRTHVLTAQVRVRCHHD